MSDDKWDKIKNKTEDVLKHPATRTGIGGIAGQAAYRVLQGNRYRIDLDTSEVCQVNVFDKTARCAEAIARNEPSRGDWVFRLDKPHGKTNYNHININPKISGRPDPHLKISSTTLSVGKGTAKVCKALNKVNKVATPIAVAVDVVSIGFSIADDVKNKTSRNTVETVAGVAGGWGGGFSGAAGGAALGTAIFPGVGTIIGGLIGGLAGGITGSVAVGKTAEAIGDACDYDTDIIKCEKCGKKFKVRRYRGEKRKPYCDECSR